MASFTDSDIGASCPGPSGQHPSYSTTISSSNNLQALTSTAEENEITESLINSKYNQISFKLKPDFKSTAYIFKEGLFKRTLLPIDLTKEREMVIQYTT